VFLVGAQQSRVFAHLQRSLSDGGQRGLEEQQFAANVLYHSLGSHERRARASHRRPARTVVVVALEHDWQRVQQAIHHSPRLLQVHEEVLRQWDDHVRDVGDDNHLWRRQ
jgi:IS5 family transposase